MAEFDRQRPEPLLARDVRTVGLAATPSVVITTWNILADALRDAFPYVPPGCLEWSVRGPAILAELTSVPLGRLPDVICLQEVDRFDELSHGLAEHGYSGLHLPKAVGRDGLALFHRRDLLVPLGFERPADARLRYRGRDGSPATQVALLARFQFHDRTLLVATTHLRAKEGHELEREAQARELCEHIDRIRRPGEAIIVAGDFNDTPTSVALESMKRSSLALKSAYTALHSGEDAWTTWKIRERETRRVIDYVFHSPELAPVRLLQAPDTAHVPAHRLPDWAFPSDHLDLAVELGLSVEARHGHQAELGAARGPRGQDSPLPSSDLDCTLEK